MPTGISVRMSTDRVVGIGYKKRNAPPWPSIRSSCPEFRRAFRSGTISAAWAYRLRRPNIPRQMQSACRSCVWRRRITFGLMKNAPEKVLECNLILHEQDKKKRGAVSAPHYRSWSTYQKKPSYAPATSCPKRAGHNRELTTIIPFDKHPPKRSPSS